MNKQELVERIKEFSTDRINYLLRERKIPGVGRYYIIFEDELKNLLKEE